MHDHFVVFSDENGSRQARIVIAESESDAAITHVRNYPKAVVTAVVEGVTT